MAGLRTQLLRSRLHGADKGLGLFGRRRAGAALKAVDGEVNSVGGRQPLHDVRFRGFIDIGWTCTGQIRTRHSDNHIGTAAIS